MSAHLRAIAFAVPMVLAAISFAPDSQAFCGFYVGGADTKLYNNATQVVLLRQGMRTVLSMQNNYQGPPEAFAMVVPVPVVLQKENVKTLPRSVFDRVDQLTAPRLVQYWEQDPCYEDHVDYKMRAEAVAAMPAPPALDVGGGGRPLVRIEAEFTVGEYDIVILSADDSSALDTWLRSNGYRIPDGAEPVLRPYVQMGSKFFVAKVDPSKVTFEKGMATLSPLRFHYDDDSFRLPVRLGLLNSSGTQDLIVNIIAKNQRYEAANYPNITIPTNIELDEAAIPAFGAFYVALFDKAIEKTKTPVVTEYAWSAGTCDPCPGPTLDPSDIATLGGDTLLTARDTDLPPGSPPPSGISPWEATITRLHVRYTKEALGEDLVFRAAAPIQGGNGWGNGPDKHAAKVVPNGQNMFQGRYIVRHRWKGEITCDNPVFDRWDGSPRNVEGAKDLAFVPREGVSLASLVAENVDSLGLKPTAIKPITRQYNTLRIWMSRVSSFNLALILGFLAGVAGILVAKRNRAPRSS
ncbi:MAG: DUF2330 domain-containing protein [Polyangiaceae bacterium]|nr:DUF2330 domain-containing protein [Polyangiaceae bacterium]